MSEEQKQPLEIEKQEIEESGPERTRARVAFVPQADIYETSESIVILADVPGVDENSIEITVEKNVLTINGYVEETKPENLTLAYAEYRVGDYQRSFSLSNQIDQSEIEATVKDGVLKVVLPKIAPSTKKIAVRGG